MIRIDKLKALIGHLEEWHKKKLVLHIKKRLKEVMITQSENKEQWKQNHNSEKTELNTIHR